MRAEGRGRRADDVRASRTRRGRGRRGRRSALCGSWKTEQARRAAYRVPRVVHDAGARRPECGEVLARKRSDAPLAGRKLRDFTDTTWFRPRGRVPTPRRETTAHAARAHACRRSSGVCVSLSALEAFPTAPREPRAMSAAARRRVTDLSSQVTSGATDVEAYTADVKACRRDLRRLIDTVNCHPILLRLAWHDAGTFDRRERRGPRAAARTAPSASTSRWGTAPTRVLRRRSGTFPRSNRSTRDCRGRISSSWAARPRWRPRAGPHYPCATGGATSRGRSSARRRATCRTLSRRSPAAPTPTRRRTCAPSSGGWASATKKSSRSLARTRSGARSRSARERPSGA